MCVCVCVCVHIYIYIYIYIYNNNNSLIMIFFNLQVAKCPSRLRFKANLSRERSQLFIQKGLI